MMASVRAALQQDAKRTVEMIDLSRAVFLAQLAAPLCLLGPDCPCRPEHAAAVDQGYRFHLVAAYGGWRS